MPYRLKDSNAVAEEIERIVTEQIDRTVDEIDDDTLDPHVAVHQVRKRCKKIRAVLRLARGPLGKDDTYAVENARYRDIARELSTLRDAEALIATHDALAADLRNPDVLIECAAVRGRLTTRRRALAEEAGSLPDKLQAARGKLLEGRERVPEWSWRVRNFQGLEPGLRRTYRRGRRAMDAAYRSLSDEDFHDWRKRVKYHWYACRLLRDIWPETMDARRREAGELAELLGDDHDLGVYRTTLETKTGWFGKTTRRDDILATVDERRAGLRREASTLGRRLYAEQPKQLSARFAAYWEAWHTRMHKRSN